VDGYFLRHFSLTRERLLAGVRAAHNDTSLQSWFLSQPSVTASSILSWNRLAPTLGMRGHPGFLTRHIVKWLLYPKSIRKPVNSLFEAIEQDELA